MKQKKQPGVLRARNAEVEYFSICALLTALGLTALIFMVVLCFRSSKPAAADMLMMLNAVQFLLICGILAAYGRLRGICRREPGFTRGAVERHEDGTARIEYAVGGRRFCLELPHEEVIEKNGMVNLWYDPRDPRRAFPGKKPQRPSAFGPASIGVLLLGGSIVNFLFFVVLT